MHTLSPGKTHQQPALDNLTLCLLVLSSISSDNFCKQFGPNSGLTKGPAWSGSKLFDALKELFEKVHFEKKSAKRQRLVQNFPECRSNRPCLYYSTLYIFCFFYAANFENLKAYCFGHACFINTISSYFFLSKFEEGGLVHFLWNRLFMSRK